MDLATYIGDLVAARQQLQLLHWQTREYDNHKALGEAVDALTDHIDEYVEVACGAADMHPADLALAPAIAEACGKVASADSPADEADMVAAIKERVAAGAEVSEAAAFLVDEMVGALAQVAYLLNIEEGASPSSATDNFGAASPSSPMGNFGMGEDFDGNFGGGDNDNAGSNFGMGDDFDGNFGASPSSATGNFGGGDNDGSFAMGDDFDGNFGDDNTVPVNMA